MPEPAHQSDADRDGRDPGEAINEIDPVPPSVVKVAKALFNRRKVADDSVEVPAENDESDPT